jgi:histidine triad (HIT) family protein
MVPPIEELNALEQDAAAAALAPLFEGAPGFVARLVDNRPYGSYAELLDHALETALTMHEEEQVELLNAHPRIGALPATVSEQSFREQGYDRDAGTTESQQRLDRLNEAYEIRFGFRFVIHVAGRPRSQVAQIMESALLAERDVEKKRALGDVIAIARDRAARSPVGDDCIFCGIVAGEAPASFVHRDDQVSAFMDIQPATPGHLLVVPNAHIERVRDLPRPVGEQLFWIALQLARGLMRSRVGAAGGHPEGTNLFVADGEAAGQEVFHAHLHVVPRWTGDGFVVTAEAYDRPPPSRSELQAQAELVRSAAAVIDEGAG